MLANDPVTQARLDLTTALRAAVRHGLNEGVCNHFSMTVPGRDDLFLVNPQGLHWSEITPSDLVIADGAGNIVEGKYQVEATAFFIHARIHAGNPRAKVVLHTHMPYATALTSIRDGRIEMCTQNAFRYWNRIAYDDEYAGVALSNEEGDRMCGAMAGKDILFLRNHGVIVSGPTVAQAYDEL
jgi:ribulose-5-phosphate 4-epimerase/fuculose-1-phosphate aldolase